MVARGRDWTREAVTRYRDWIDGFCQGLRDRGVARDCADLAIDSVITFARDNRLHFEFTWPAQGVTKSEEDFPTYDQFNSYLRRNAGAQNLADRQNTRLLGAEGKGAGDLLIYNWRGTSTWHTVIYISDQKLWKGNEDVTNRPVIPEPITVQGSATTQYTILYYLNHSDMVGGSARRWRIFHRF